MPNMAAWHEWRRGEPRRRRRCITHTIMLDDARAIPKYTHGTRRVRSGDAGASPSASMRAYVATCGCQSSP
eukprot:1243964-Lingulodinium_polyedra.AAC.1